jgi:glycosyltransferase involved in cell wall biosynthesis
MARAPLPVTVIVAVKNEAANIARCLRSLSPAQKIYVIDSQSSDDTATISAREGAEVVQFEYRGGYPKKRQWALDRLPIDTQWIMVVDADETLPDGLWDEIGEALHDDGAVTGYFATKEFHFLGRRLRFGGFSHSALLLFRKGSARYENIVAGDTSGLDMEVHERVLVNGATRHFATPLIHDDFKGLDAYMDRHNRYSTWEARVRAAMLEGGRATVDAIRPRLFGNVQERRRWLKSIAIRMPFEPLLWFAYHYVVRLGFLEGRRGLIASVIRAYYIGQVRAKVYEARLER